MRDVYIKNYADGMMLRVSLDLLWHHISRPPKSEVALTMTQWGPLYLTINNAPYVPTFIRAADRSLFHATNAWRNLVLGLSANTPFHALIPDDAVLQTNDRSTEYEIEAFLGASVTLTEENLIGVTSPNKYNRLGKSTALGDQLITQLREEAIKFRALGFEKKWRAVRNSAYHLNPGMTDWGIAVQIQKSGAHYSTHLEGSHYVEGAPVNLVDLFAESFSASFKYVMSIRDILTRFSFQQIAVPQHTTYSGILDALGNMNVSFGPNGYELRQFPQTASDFVGPLKTD